MRWVAGGDTRLRDEVAARTIEKDSAEFLQRNASRRKCDIKHHALFLSRESESRSTPSTSKSCSSTAGRRDKEQYYICMHTRIAHAISTSVCIHIFTCFSFLRLRNRSTFRDTSEQTGSLFVISGEMQL